MPANRKLKASYDGMISYNVETERFCIGDHELHCGEEFYIKCLGQWLKARIELDRSTDLLGHWYLEPLVGPVLENCLGCCVPAKWRN